MEMPLYILSQTSQTTSMEGMQPGSSSQPREYADFEPRSYWVHGDKADTLIVDASGMCLNIY